MVGSYMKISHVPQENPQLSNPVDDVTNTGGNGISKIQQSINHRKVGWHVFPMMHLSSWQDIKDWLLPFGCGSMGILEPK